MPVSVCDPVRAALRDSLSAGDDQLHLERQLMTSAKRVLITRIEYEEAPNYNSSVLDTLKFKCVVLNANKPSTDDKNMPAAKSPSSEGLPSPKRILFTQEAVQLGWSSSNQHKWAVGAGMNNVGNTCYLNSTLQALFHVPALANWLVSDGHHRDRCEETSGSQGGCIICAMSKTLLASQSNSGAITPWLVYSKLRFVCRHMVPGRQEDAHEFLRYLVEAMEKAFLSRIKNSRELDQYSKETTPLNRILGGYVRTAVRCLSCGYVSTTFQHFQDLLLDIRKASTVDEALAGYFARERLEDMGYRCESCKSMVSATKQFSLEKAPNVLCIQLKRFSMMGSKLNKHVYFNARLDLSQFASKPSSEPLTYQLVSLVTHLGSSQHCGHYTAIGMAEGGTYYQFDDSCVRSLSLQSVLSTNAYIIIYELERPKSALTKQTRNINNDVVKYPTVPNDPSLSRLALTMPPKRPVETAPVTVLSKSSPSASPGKICFSISPKKPEPVSSPKGSGFIGPIQPPPNHLGSKLVMTSNKPEYMTNGTENKFVNTGSKLILTSPKPVMNGPKPVQSDNQSSSNGNPKSLPRLQVNGKKMTNGMVKPVKEPQSVKPLTVNGLKINGVNGIKDNNCSIGPVRGLVPYSLDDSDESSSENIVKPVITSEREQLVITKAAVAGWKVTTSASSPSLQGKAGWSSKTQEIRVIEEPVQQVLNGHTTYAPPVMSWTGNRAHMDREVEQDRREDRKRAYNSTDYMDCGRTKKVKVHVERQRFNHGYNPFQETHNGRRWRSHNDKPYYDDYSYNEPQRNNSYHRGYKGSRHRGGYHNHPVRTHVQRNYRH